MSLFQKAEKRKQKLRLGIAGVAGAGKTFTSLSVASGMVSKAGKTAVIDTEFGSASLYADRFDFHTLNLSENAGIKDYVTSIEAAGKEGFEVIIVDSATHAWKTLLDEVEKIAKARYRGNTFAAWNEGTPLQQSFINAMKRSPAHVIMTMRVNTDWSIEEINGKKKPVKVGLKPEQRKDMDFEYDVFVEIGADHIAHFTKDRTGKFQDHIIEKPGPEFGKELIEWLNTGIDQVDSSTVENAFKAAKTLDDLQKAAAQYANFMNLFSEKVRQELRNVYLDTMNIIKGASNA